MEVNSCKNLDKLTPIEKEHMPQLEIIKYSQTSADYEVKINYQHSMAKDHYLEWIKIYRNDILSDRVNLSLEDRPQANLKIKLSKDDELKILTKCSKHGVWQEVKDAIEK